MKLSSQQARILVAAQLRADQPISKLRAKLSTKEHTIRYTLERAKRLGIIERRYFINLFKLGFLQHELFFSISAEKRGVRDSLLARLKRADNISWIGRLGGDYQYGVNICSRDLHATVTFFDDLSASHGGDIVEKNLSLRVSLTFFGNRYLAPNQKISSPLSYLNSPDIVSIDDTDHRLLRAITSDGELSGHDIARSLGIPQSTVDYRLKRLRSDGVIVGAYYVVRGEMLGVMSFLCLIRTRGISARFREAIAKFCLAHPEVVVMIESIGSWDFELVIDGFSAEQVMRVSESLLDLFSGAIQWIKMVPIFGYPKVCEYPLSHLAGKARAV
jgi:DNA-binding Lrp family transcriptional regulator